MVSFELGEFALEFRGTLLEPGTESAALRYLERYIVEERASLTDVATIASLLAEGERP